MFSTGKLRIALIFAAAALGVAAADPQPQATHGAAQQPHQSGPLVRGAPPEAKAELDSIVDDAESRVCVIRNVGWCNYEPAGQRGSACACGKLYGQLN